MALTSTNSGRAPFRWVVAMIRGTLLQFCPPAAAASSSILLSIFACLSSTSLQTMQIFFSLEPSNFQPQNPRGGVEGVGGRHGRRVRSCARREHSSAAAQAAGAVVQDQGERARPAATCSPIGPRHPAARALAPLGAAQWGLSGATQRLTRAHACNFKASDDPQSHTKNSVFDFRLGWLYP